MNIDNVKVYLPKDPRPRSAQEYVDSMMAVAGLGLDVPPLSDYFLFDDPKSRTRTEIVDGKAVRTVFDD